MQYIHVEELSKTYTLRKKQKGSFLRRKEQLQALRDVSFDISRGELVGYIGPNGAGKSTTVKILSGILTPDGGAVSIGGICPWKERKKHVSRIGVVFGQRTQLWWDVPVMDSYELLRDIYRVSGNDFRTRLAQLTDALELGPIIHTPLRQLSLGQRMRAELGGSLLHRPDLLFLDEPTIGLDAVSKLMIRDFLKAENKQNGTTVMLTTHDMEDIAALCSRVMVLGKGTKLYDGSLHGLLSRYDREHIITVRFESAPENLVLPQGCTVTEEAGIYRITYDPDAVSTGTVLLNLQNAGTIGELTAQSENIDHLVASMYRGMGM